MTTAFTQLGSATLARTPLHAASRRPFTVRQLAAAALLGVGLASLSSSHAQSCTVSALAPAFGVYSPSGSSTLANGLVTVSCNVQLLPLNVFYTIQLGLGSQPTGQQRQLAGGPGGTARLQYNLFCDAARTQIWADGSGSSCTVSGGQALLLGGLLTLYPVYGRVPTGQYVPAGSYSDVIAVDVLY